MRTTTLLQLTDLHLTDAPGQRLGGWDTWAALDTVLDEIAAREPAEAALLLTGDLVHDGALKAYRNLARRLQATGRPYYVIPGNHDLPSNLFAAFPQSRMQEQPLGPGWVLLLLDSHRAGSDAGQLGQAQIEAVEQRLTACRSRNLKALLAIHHPPVATGSAWLDSIGLDDAEKLLEACAPFASSLQVVCGHAHQRFESIARGIPVDCTPSTNRQFTVQSAVFSVDDDAAPGYRRLLLRDDGSFYSEVIRLAECKVHFQAT